MASLLHPHAEDVVVRREPRGTFTIGVSAGESQLDCSSLGEALQCAGRFAAEQNVHLWCTAADGSCTPLGDVQRLRTIWNEYIEMPRLRLTLQQARRLWSLDLETCRSLLDNLVTLKFLERGPDEKYGRRVDAVEPGPRPRMAMAGIHPRRRLAHSAAR